MPFLRAARSLAPAPSAGKYKICSDGPGGGCHTAGMPKYGQYCPVAKSAEIVGDRWTLLILRELLTAGPSRFGALLTGLPGISPTLLAGRLRALERWGVVARRQDQARPLYGLTPSGRQLEPAILALGEWAARHVMRDPTAAELDPPVLMLWIQRHIHRDQLPPQRVVVRFDFRGARRASHWLVLERGAASVCLTDPGFDVDLLVDADTVALYHVYFGRIALGTALRDGRIALEGPSALVRQFPRWIGTSAFAPALRAALGPIAS